MSDRNITTNWEAFDPAAYLREYYADLGSENLALLRFLDEVFRTLPAGGTLLDFGGGPTIYPLVSAARNAREIHFSDYLEANLAEVRRWLSSDRDAFDWQPFVAETLRLELGRSPSPAEIAERERLIRERVTRVIHCDASRSPSIGDGDRSYDVVLTNFCAESATADRWQWQAFITNIAALVSPGGHIILSSLAGATSYAVGPVAFPAVSLSEDDVVEILEECGFLPKSIELQRVPADRPTREYSGLIFAVARKRSGSGPE